MKRPSLKLIFFVVLSAIAIWMSYFPSRALLRNTKGPEYYSHIPLIPVISAYFLFRRRKEIFHGQEPYYLPGLAGVLSGIALFVASKIGFAGSDDYASGAAFSACVFWAGSFLFLFGRRAFRKAIFPVAFLLFVVPLPSAVLEKIISALVATSIAVTSVIFKVVGVHFARQGSVFHLPGFDLEVAQECSGIRSSLALLITGVLAGHLFLRKMWKKAVLALAVFPIAVFKNGLRIVGLYLLSYYIDMRFIEGDFHHKFAGSVFFVLGLVFLGIVLWMLRRSETA